MFINKRSKSQGSQSRVATRFSKQYSMAGVNNDNANSPPVLASQGSLPVVSNKSHLLLTMSRQCCSLSGEGGGMGAGGGGGLKGSSVGSLGSVAG